jgi:hypothetical protein
MSQSWPPARMAHLNLHDEVVEVLLECHALVAGQRRRKPFAQMGECPLSLKEAFRVRVSAIKLIGRFRVARHQSVLELGEEPVGPIGPEAARHPKLGQTSPARKHPKGGGE